MRVARETIWTVVEFSWDMDNTEPKVKSFLLNVHQPPVLYVGEGPVVEDVQQRLVIRCDGEVIAA